jgi:FkbM family methyltransferase
MSPSLNAFTESSVGRILYRPFQAALHLFRRLAHPGIPASHKIARVSYRFRIEHRRWSDKLILDECFKELQYELPRGAQGSLAERLFRDIVDSGKKPLIVDCGANIGVSVLWFTARYPEAHIVAIEPAPDNFAMLQRNCKGLEVDLRNVAIGPVDGAAHLSVEGLAGYAYQINLDGHGLPTQLVSLSTILAAKPSSTYRPFLLKVDIEGSEKALFSSGHAFLNEFPIILMEPHDWLFPGQGTSLEFFRFHADTRREVSIHKSTFASVALHPAGTHPEASGLQK